MSARPGAAPEGSGAAAREAARILGLVAEPDRLRVVAALVLGATTVAEIAAASDLEAREVERALGRLVAGDLVTKHPSGHRFMVEELQAAAARVAGERKLLEALPGGRDAEVAARFLRGGRLVSIPATRAKRLAVLDHLAQEFEPGRRYPERRVNQILAPFHDDVALIRRYLVDEGLLERDRGVYWRSGGTFEVD